MNAPVAETILDPELPIVDSHHHLWFMSPAMLAFMESRDSLTARALAPVYRQRPRYLFEEFMADINSGHNIRATVHVNSHSMYRMQGPAALRSVGEIEFINGVAAMSASGNFGDVRVCAGIVGGVDLMVGESIEEVLEAHIRAGGGRYRGVRFAAFYDEDPNIFGAGGAPHVLLDPKFRAGFARLQPLGLSFDALLLAPQLPDLIDLARAFPQTQIVLNHAGCPAGIGRYAGRQEEQFAHWRTHMQALAGCENVTVKLGGFGTPFGGFKSFMASPPLSSEQLAAEWRPYIETCIEKFGAQRCMFESNYPVDVSVGSYAVMWNAFKRLASGASPAEKTALFSGTASTVYRLEF